MVLSQPTSSTTASTGLPRIASSTSMLARLRVNIAVGLLADPPVLLLDEPSGALDPRQRQRLWGFINALTERGTSVVFATHDISEAERHGDRVLVLADGELLFSGTPKQLETTVGESRDFESAFVRFLHERGH